MLKAARILRILLPLLLVSCVYEERPSDLRLEKVYVVDISATLAYKAAVAKGMLPPPVRLTIELSTTETFPLGVRVSWGFCGEKKRPYYLYRATDPNDELESGLSAHHERDRHLYLAVLAIVFKLVPPLPALPDYDLRDNSHDICLNTGSGTYADVWSSNEVRVPRSLIEKALHDLPHTSFPLSPNQLP
jgi:hypothetical protein